jgi:hypothetical protein
VTTNEGWQRLVNARRQGRTYFPEARSFKSAGLAAVAACYYLASVNSTASLVIVPFEMAMNLPSAEKR